MHSTQLDIKAELNLRYLNEINIFIITLKTALM